jgi:hypothetical protein
MNTMKLTFTLMACLLMGGVALSVNSGSILDSDTGVLPAEGPDGIPDVFDNCVTDSNGPASPPAVVANDQVDVDGDGFGIRCDPDYNQDGSVGVGDFNLFFACFSCPGPAGSGVACGAACAGASTAAGVASTDHNQDTTIGVGDFNIFFSKFPGVPGPSCGGPPKGGVVPAAGEVDGTGPCG